MLKFFFTLLWGAGVAFAQSTADLEQRVQRIAEELRCLVCQNQSLADSHADLAVDLKNQVREKLREGASEKEVLAFMTERYGDFVLYRPPLKATTLLLWFGPGAALVIGLIALFLRLRRRTALAAEPALTAEQRAHAAALLDTSREPDPR